MPSLSAAALGELLALLRASNSNDPPPDGQQLVRMWLVTTGAPGPGAAPAQAQAGESAGPGPVFLTEVHGASRLMSTPDGMSYLTPEGRWLVGVGWAVREVRVPSPVELHERMTDDVAASLRGESDLARSDRWRLQRLLKAMRRPSANSKRWAVFVLGNELEETVVTRFGVCLADGRRLGVAVAGAARGSVAEPGDPIPDDAPYWQDNELAPFTRALVDLGRARAEGPDRDNPGGMAEPADVTLW